MNAMLRHTRTISSVLAACTLFAARAASAQYIDLPGTQPGGLAAGSPLDSGRSCGTTCHSSRDASSNSPMPFDGWIGSMMGNTMRDPLYLAALTVAEQDHPGVGDYCLRCHTPPGFVAGRTRSSATAPLGSDLTLEDREGVTCDVCHRSLDTPNLGNAQYVFSPTETRFGPYPVIDSIRHPGEQSPWPADARLCGTCHDITNPLQPLRRADGTDTGQRFPLDTTYSEWSQSAFAVAGSADARTCQDCHLPRIDGSGYVATTDSAMLRDQPRRHDFAGANAWALRVLAAMRADTASGEFYDPDSVPFYEAGARRAEASLRTAVTLELRQVPATAVAGSSVEVIARITNRSGHRVPTGYADGRRVWLAVELLDASGHATVVSGAYDDAAAHLDETDPQLRLYEAWQGRVGVGREDHIALHDTIVRDTRLPPMGYHPLPGHEPVGVDYSGGDNGALRHWDDATYLVHVPADATGTLTVRVRARYQTTTREYVEFLASQNHTDTRGQDLLARYEASGRAPPFDMAEVTKPIVINAVPDAGVADSGDAGASADGGREAGSDAGAGADAGPSRVPAGCGCRTAGGSGSRARGAGAAVLALGALAAVGRRRRRRRARG
jgi:MYXO-CTERM domain-containing protein